MRADDYFSPPDANLAEAINARWFRRAKIRAALQAGANPNARGKEGLTPLFWAILHHRLDAVHELIQRHADVNCSADDGSSPVGLAVLQPDPTYLRVLLHAGASPNGKDHVGDPAIVVATENGRVEQVRLLLRSSQIEVDQPNHTGMTALGAAVLAHKLPLVTLLVEAGANPMAELSAGRTPLGMARRLPNRQELVGLLSAGQDDEERDREAARPCLSPRAAVARPVTQC